MDGCWSEAAEGETTGWISDPRQSVSPGALDGSIQQHKSASQLGKKTLAVPGEGKADSVAGEKAQPPDNPRDVSLGD